MDALENFNQKTMSSREIAELTGKRHDHVLRDCDVLNESYENLGLPKIGETPYINQQNGQQYREYQLTKIQTFDLMTGYSVELRIKVNRRWEQLETKQLDFTNPQTVLVLAQNWADEQQKRIQAESVIAEQAPKVLFADSVSGTTNSVLVNYLATILKQNGIDIGQNRLFAWLRNNGYLLSKGDYYNRPSQKAMELGLFEIKPHIRQDPNKGPIETFTTRVTGKGQIYFVNKFLNDKSSA